MDGKTPSGSPGVAAEAGHWKRLTEGFIRRPGLAQKNLSALAEAGLIDAVPNRFQRFMGVMYMRYRIAFRSETIGVDDVDKRQTWRARWLGLRPLRAPFLVWEGGIAPGDLTGFSASPSYLIRHLLTAYHPGENARYDLALLAAHPGALEALRAQLVPIVADPDHWKRDLVVYEGYHERLLTLVDRALDGDFSIDDPESVASDASLRGFVGWCSAQPRTAREAVRAALRGEISLRPR